MDGANSTWMLKGSISRPCLRRTKQPRSGVAGFGNRSKMSRSDMALPVPVGMDAAVPLHNHQRGCHGKTAVFGGKGKEEHFCFKRCSPPRPVFDHGRSATAIMTRSPIASSSMSGLQATRSALLPMVSLEFDSMRALWLRCAIGRLPIGPCPALLRSPSSMCTCTWARRRQVRRIQLPASRRRPTPTPSGSG